jgi:hypothetical protein
VIVTALAVIGAYAVVGTVWGVILFLFHDRQGNSGRYKHWENEGDE